MLNSTQSVLITQMKHKIGPIVNYLISEEIFSIDSVSWGNFVLKCLQQIESMEKISSLIK